MLTFRDMKKLPRKHYFKCLRKLDDKLFNELLVANEKAALEENVKEFGLTYFGLADRRQGTFLCLAL